MGCHEDAMPKLYTFDADSYQTTKMNSLIGNFTTFVFAILRSKYMYELNLKTRVSLIDNSTVAQW